MRIVSSKYRDREGEATIVIHEVANSTITIVGNNTTSNICPSNTQSVISASINRVWHGSANSGYWKVARGSNTVGVYNNTGAVEYNGSSLVLDKTGTLVLTLNGTVDGYIMLELKAKITGA
jgi:hypothetical protein